jgi:hypothetical protein
MLPPIVVDRGFESRLGQTKDYNISICCLTAKHAALRRKVKDWLARNQDNVSEWANMSIRRIKMEGHKVMTKAHLAYAWLFSDCYVFSVTFHLYCTIEVSILTYNQYDVHSKYKIDLDKLKKIWKITMDWRWKSNNQPLFYHNRWQEHHYSTVLILSKYSWDIINIINILWIFLSNSVNSFTYYYIWLMFTTYGSNC